MPLLWRYLLRNFFKVLILSLTSFISVLLVTRFKEIAQFASSGSSLWTVCLFAIYQIPYILPIALPISCLIAAIILFQRLSASHELTAFRSAGLGLKPIIYPLMIAGGFLSFVNFFFVSELSPYCRALSKELVYESTAHNPLFLAQKKSLIRIKDCYFDIKSLEPGKAAKEALIIINNRSNERLGMLTAKKLHIAGDLLKGEQVTIISGLDSKKTDAFDHLVIENQKVMSTKAANLMPYIQTLEGRMSYDYMPLRMILAKTRFEKSSKFLAKGKGLQEVSRRLAFALAAFTFTFIGATFGMEIGRDQKRRGLYWGIALAGATLICFLTAKSMRHSYLSSSLIFLIPHPIVFIFCLRYLNRVSRGIE